MPAAKLPPPAVAEEASAAIRSSLAAARERFAQGALAVRGDLSGAELGALAGYAEDLAAAMVDACCSPEVSGLLRGMAATGQEADAGEDVPA